MGHVCKKTVRSEKHSQRSEKQSKNLYKLGNAWDTDLIIAAVKISPISEFFFTDAEELFTCPCFADSLIYL